MIARSIFMKFLLSKEDGIGGNEVIKRFISSLFHVTNSLYQENYLHSVVAAVAVVGAFVVVAVVVRVAAAVAVATSAAVAAVVVLRSCPMN